MVKFVFLASVNFISSCDFFYLIRTAFPVVGHFVLSLFFILTFFTYQHIGIGHIIASVFIIGLICACHLIFLCNLYQETHSNLISDSYRRIINLLFILIRDWVVLLCVVEE